MSKNTIKTYVLLAALGGFFILIGGARLKGPPLGVRLFLPPAHGGGSDWVFPQLPREAPPALCGPGAVAPPLRGASLLGTGAPLAGAGEKTAAGARQPPMDVTPARAQAYIHNPLTGRKMGPDRLFMTHPATDERVARLRKMHPG